MTNSVRHTERTPDRAFSSGTDDVACSGPRDREPLVEPGGPQPTTPNVTRFGEVGEKRDPIRYT